MEGLRVLARIIANAHMRRLRDAEGANAECTGNPGLEPGKAANAGSTKPATAGNETGGNR